MTNDVQEVHGMGWLPQPPDHRDFTLEIHESGVLRNPPSSSTNLINLAPPIRNQGTLGSCTAFGSLSAFQITSRRNNLKVRMGSELMQYFEARRFINTLHVDSGAYIRDAIKALANVGMAPEEDWPYDISKFTQPPPGVAYQHALNYQALKYIAVPNHDETMKQVLTGGFPIVIGFSVPQNFPMGKFTGPIPMPSGNIIGGHAVCIVGHDDEKQCWIIRNSWGTNWGQDGYAWMPYPFLRALGDDFWMLDTVEGDPLTPPEPTPEPGETDAQALRRILGSVSQIDVHFTKAPSWPLAIQAPPQGAVFHGDGTREISNQEPPSGNLPEVQDSSSLQWTISSGSSALTE